MRHLPDLPAAVQPLRRARAWFVAALLTLASLALLPLSARAQFGERGEYEVKAAFLTNFTQFVKWPAAAFADAGAPFAIGILGDDPFGGELEKIAQTRTVTGRKIIIRRGQRPEDVRNCQVVFFSKSERGRIVELIAGFQGANILTVGESAGFARQGGIIEFAPRGNTVGFVINAEAGRKAGLGISSKLLKLGRATPSN